MAAARLRARGHGPNGPLGALQTRLQRGSAAPLSAATPLLREQREVDLAIATLDER